MDYNLMMQKALLGMVKDVLLHVRDFGLEGEQCLYISFRTDANGVVIPMSLRQKFPEEMTIVLQRQFWDFRITDEYFSVKLSFNGKSEAIEVPFSSLAKIFDPSVQFGLQFAPEQVDGSFIEDDSEPNEEENLPGEVVKSASINNIIDFAEFKNRSSLRR
jgi:hypothetical protein